MELTTVWFTLIAVLWTGYFILEGFDFGVGALLPILGRNDTERRLLINTIGPVWDGNEVWVIVAAGATFAAFPHWYATLFSGFYLPLLLILVALILRGVAFEYRGKRPDPRWRRRFDTAIVFGSVVPAVVWGIAFANIVRGLPIDADKEYAGTLVDLLNPHALLGGLTTLALFVTHGAVFIALKTRGDIRNRANTLAFRAGTVAAVLTVAFLAWTYTLRGDATSATLSIAAVVAFAASLIAARAGRDGWAFTGTAATIMFTFAAIFVALYPNVMPSTLGPANHLTVTNAASTPYTLTIMTWVAAIFTPLVLLYQGWTYWVFRKRLTIANIPTEPTTSSPR